MDTTAFDGLMPYLVPPNDQRHRLFHGRGKAIPALEWLTIDRFSPVLMATLFRPQPADVIEQLAGILRQHLTALGCDALLFQHRYEDPARNECVVGELPVTPYAKEAGLRYRLDFERGQNVGFFADMAPGRAWLKANAHDKSVLNLFSFTCSFSVAALAGGARQVVNIDLSRAALALGEQNHRCNDIPTDCVHFLDHNIFRSWKKLHKLGRYDIIVMDPPSAQKGSFMVERDYGRVLAQLHRLLTPQADLLLCLNAPWLSLDWLEECVARHLPGAEKVHVLSVATGFVEQQEPALKVVHYRYRRPE